MRPLHRALGLGEDRAVGAPAAARRRAAAAVEELERDARLARLRGELLLRVVQRPRSSRRSPCPCRSPSSRPSPSGGWPACAGARRRARRRRARPSSPAPARAPRGSRTAAPSAARSRPARCASQVAASTSDGCSVIEITNAGHGLRAVGVGRSARRCRARAAARPPRRPGRARSRAGRRPAPRSAAPGGAARRRRRSPAGSRAVASRTTPAPWRMSIPARWKPKTSTCHSSRRIDAERDVARVEVGEHELEVAPQRLRVGVAGLAPARA